MEIATNGEIPTGKTQNSSKVARPAYERWKDEIPSQLQQCRASTNIRAAQGAQVWYSALAGCYEHYGPNVKSFEVFVEHLEAVL